MNQQNPITSPLNKRQKEAVEILSGPLLILAGAGSGKTKCLTHRIANLIAHGTDGKSILAVTFTNKAANEMKERIEKLLKTIQPNQVQKSHTGGLDDLLGEASSPSGHFQMPAMGTFHSICVRILRQEIEQLVGGYDRNFVIFDTGDVQSLMKLLIKESPFDDKEIKHKAVLSHISNAKNQLITPRQYDAETDSNRFTKAVKHLYPLYQKRLEEHNALDFDDLLQKTVQLFEQHPEILKKYQDRWQHVLVDEYQDTNFAQYRIIRLLVEPHKNLCVIGDDHQSIYSFRGADYTNILNFEKDFPDAKTVKLEQNYRSTNRILSNANTLIGHNETGRPKNLWTDNEDGEKVIIQESMDERDEGNQIAKEIQDLIQNETAAHKDIAVLYRMNAQSRAIEEALMRHQIPYQIVGGTRFFDRKEIKDIIAYLRLLFNPKDNLAFLRIINVPSRRLGAATIDVLKQYAFEYQCSLFEILEHVEEMDEIANSKKVLLKDFQEIILKLQVIAQSEPLSITLDRLIEYTDFYTFLNDGTMEGESRIQNVKELFSVAGRYDGADQPLAAFLEGVALIADIDNLESSDAVTLMTIHSSKGLEFPVVYLPGWEEGIFPSTMSLMSGRNESEEERRLAYVAITRSEKKCTISYTKQRTLFGRREYMVPSPFLGELDEHCVERRVSESTPTFSRSFQPRKEAPKYSTPFANPNPKTRKEALFGVQESVGDYKPSDRIKHNEWGEGTIIQVSGDVLTVSFEKIGIKKIVGSVAPIEKM